MLNKRGLDAWFSEDVAGAREVLQPNDEDALEALPISTFVNDVRNDSPAIVKPLDENVSEPMSLF